MAILFQLLIVAVALGGFGIAFYIHRHKKHGQPLVCPLQSDCQAVVHSEYSTLLGVPLENWGMFYYAVIAVTYTAFIGYPHLPTAVISQLWALASVIAFLISIYLTYIQAVKLREWCTWCLTSALFSSVIFLAVLGLWFLQ